MAADILLRGAAVYTMDPRRPRASNIAIADGRIVACESASLDDLTGPRTRLIDLHGRAIVPGSRTAHTLEPYVGREDGYRGVPTMQPDEFFEAMRLAADADLDLAVHAIGDAAVRAVLDAYERTLAAHPALAERMLRIEHAQLIHPDDMPRFAALGVIASMQPIHAAADWRAADAHWGPRSRHAYAWRSLLDAGAGLAFGTDAPVERLEPLASLYAATTRQEPHGEPAGGWYPAQCLSLEEAVYAYTVGSATAERAGARRGTLTAGKDADLVVLSADPFALPHEALLSIQVELTMVGGRITFEELAS